MGRGGGKGGKERGRDLTDQCQAAAYTRLYDTAEPNIFYRATT